MCESILNELNNEECSISERYISIYRKILSTNKTDNYLSFMKIIEVSDTIDYPETEDEEQVREIVLQYYRLLSDLVSAIAKLNLIPESFYEKLYKSIFQSDIFPETEADRGIILYILAQKMPSLPYRQAHNPVVLEDERFSDLVDSIKDELSEALYFMFNNRFNSRTEAASQLSDIAESLDSREKKAVFWACVLINAQRQSEDDE